MEQIKRVYKGLPLDIQDEILWVARNFRTNPLSHQPGGSDIVVEYQDGSVYGYDWIKKPSSYINAILHRTIEDDHDITLGELDEREQLEVIKDVVRKIYGRRYDNDEEQKAVPFEEVWNADNASQLPSDTLNNVLEKRDLVKKPKHNSPTNDDDLPF